MIKNVTQLVSKENLNATGRIFLSLQHVFQSILYKEMFADLELQNVSSLICEGTRYLRYLSPV